MAKKKTSKKPSGLTVKRNGNKFVCEWKKGETYEQQEFRIGQTAVGAGRNRRMVDIIEKVTKSATKHTVTINLADYAPYTSATKTSFYFGVRGHAKDENWSDWRELSRTIYPPKTPSVSMSITNSHAAGYSWSVADAGADSWYAFNRVEWQTAWTSETASPVWGAINTSYAPSYTWSKDETSPAVATGSHTRWFRARSRGMAGNSAWSSPIKRVYATPHNATIKTASCSKVGEGLSCVMTWETSANGAYPVDSTEARYVVVEPDANMTLPSGELNWTTCGTVGGTTVTRTDKAQWTINGGVEDDKVAFVQVVNTHEERPSYSTPVILKGYKWTLSDPTDLSITEVDASQHKVTLSANNTSSVQDSYLVVTYKDDGDYKNGVDIGIIEGQGSVSGVIKYPTTTSTNISFGVRAVVGSKGTPETKADGSKAYSITNPVMESRATLWRGGNLPVAPTNVTVTSSEVAGSARVSWNWSWAGADSAILSWADHIDAWESTDEPEEYVVSNIHASTWNIAGLEVGKTWYVRVRFASTNDDKTTYGPWSKITPETTVDLATTPATPFLRLSPETITEEQLTTAYWSYSTTDGQPQSYAELCVATIDNGVITYGEPIAYTETAYHIDLDPKEHGWKAGDTVRLCVRVTSSAGKESDGWSIPATLHIANELDCQITHDSLELGSEEVNPREFTGNPVDFSTTMEEDVTRLEVGLEPIQDLHGYDKPWAEGAGVNLLPPMVDGTYSGNGVTAVVKDGIATFSGTSTSSGNALIIPLADSFTVPNDTVYLHCMNSVANASVSPAIENSADVSQNISYSLAPANRIVQINSSKVGNTYNRIRFYLGNGVTISGTYAPMVCKDDTVRTYEPYSNICPISGRTECVTSVCGVNVWDEEWEVGTIDANGQNASASNRIRTKNYISVVGGTQYLINKDYGRCCCYDADKNFTQECPWGYGAVSGTYYLNVPSGTSFIRISFTTSYGSVYNNDISINYPSTDHEYYAYNGHTYTTDLGRTVYGGTVDVVSGELTVTHEMITYDGSSDESWTISSAWGKTNTAVFYTDLIPNAYYPDYTAYKGAISNLFESATRNYIYGNDVECIGYSGSPITNPTPTVRISRATADNATDFRTFLSNTPLQFCYELATPQTYQLTPQEVQTLVGKNYVATDDGELTVRIAESIDTGYFLKEMPLNVTVTGAGDGGKTTVVIERDGNYPMDRPDGTDFEGFDKETIALESQTGEDEITINNIDLLGSLDDGATYNIVATVEDEAKQVKTVEKQFKVRWRHQAVKPEAEVEVIEGGVVKIMPKLPSGATKEDGDLCDIYRLSADLPELVYAGAEFGTWYVDPYPAIGEFGGHRLVYRTNNGDYITEDNEIAWLDLGEDDGDILESESVIIDFAGEQIELVYGVDFSNSWEKDFREQRYLGGSIKGDWNAGVRRSSSISASTINVIESDKIRALRRLANHDGVCHVRTPDGSSYACDIQENDDWQGDKYGEVTGVSFNVTRVESQGYDGMTLERWNDINGLE